MTSLIPAFALIGLESFTFGAIGSTHIYLIEQYVCHEHYITYDPQSTQEVGLIDESLCKLLEIQSRVAQINGIYVFLSFLPALILSGPWATLAHNLGKMKVLFLNTLGILLGSVYFVTVCFYRQYFDIRLIWLKPLFNIIGGGQVILSSLVMTYVAESIDSKNLSAVLYKFSAMCLCMVFLGLSLSAVLLRVNVWLLCSIGLAAHTLMIPVTLLFPSSPTSKTFSSSSSFDHNCTSNTASAFEYSSEATTLLSCPSCNISRPSALRTVLDALKSSHRHNGNIYGSILCTSPTSRLTIIAFFLLKVVDGIQIIFTQWASVTYHWIIADVQALSSFEMIVSGTILLSLPILTIKYLTPYLNSPSAIDMFVSKFSLMFLFVGLGLMSIAPTSLCYVLAVTVCTLSTPLVDSLRSFSTGLVSEKEEIEKLYLGISMVETVGGMISTAVWSGLFSNVLGRGWILERTPFWSSLAIVVGVWLVLRRLASLGSVEEDKMLEQAERDGEMI